MRTEILTILKRRGFIQSVDLALAVMDLIGPTKLDTQQFHDALESLVRDGSIVELEYTLLSNPDRIKSLYFEQGTTFINKETLLESTSQTRLARDSHIDSQFPYLQTKRE